MKKLTPIFIICICLLLSTPLSAHSDTSPITVYTEAEIYYEAITLDTFSVISLKNSDMMNVTKQITYDGIISPPSSISWEEKIDGITYSGTLYLQSFYQQQSKTVATYKGTLYAQ